MTVRADLELRLLRACIALMRASPTAEQQVRDVLLIVERHGFLQTVLDTAPQLVEHLVAHSDRYPATDSLVALIAAGVETRKLTVPRRSTSGLPDPLTDAELRVLETLPLRLTYGEIAADLHLSLNTVKTHLRHIYMKLGVSSRSAAVKRATALAVL